MLKICLVSNSAWSVYNFRIDIIRHFIRNGHAVTVLAANDEYASLLQEEGCHFEPIQFNNRTENPVSDYLLYVSLKKHYRQLQPHIVFHYVIKPNIYGSLAAAVQKVPSVAVITGLGYAFSKANWLYFLTKLLYTYALKKPREVWFLNNEDAKFFTDKHIVQLEKIRVLHGEGINTDFFSPGVRTGKDHEPVFKFLMSTRLLKSKGVAIYADAARILKRKKYKVVCELIGFYEKHHPDSIDQEDILKWEKEGLIHYRGFADDVRIFLSQADCFVFPSFYNEGVPRCLMEAASMALPVITSRNRGCKDVVTDNSTGYLCNMNNPFDLADKMEKMLKLDPEERLMMGQNGRVLVEKRFDVQRIIEVYEQAITGPVPTGD